MSERRMRRREKRMSKMETTRKERTTLDDVDWLLSSPSAVDFVLSR